MNEWIAITDGFIKADFIRWKEVAYGQRRSRRGRAPRLGKRIVTAEVLQGPDRKGWVRLLARHCETIEQLSIRKLPSLLPGDEIRRARRTIMRGNPERLLWSDESARAAVVASKYRGKR